MRAVFMGTPSFVTPVLGALISDQQVDVVGVYTPGKELGGRSVHVTRANWQTDIHWFRIIFCQYFVNRAFQHLRVNLVA